MNNRNRNGRNRNRYSGSNSRNSHTGKESRGSKPSGNRGTGFSRPGPFGFKARPLPFKEQAVANPFGFASHNVVNVSGSDRDSNSDE